MKETGALYNMKMSNDHLRAFAKLVMALDSLPGVTLASSSTALFEKY